jgi:hypothetical protein
MQDTEKLREFDHAAANLRPMTEQEQLDNWFSYHPPLAGQAETYAKIRAGGKAFAELLVASCPPSADRTAAIRHIREAVYNANASIACGGR